MSELVLEPPSPEVSEQRGEETPLVGEDRTVPRAWIVICGLVLVAIVASSCRLASHSLWFDESWSLLTAQQHGAQFWRVLFHGDPDMTLYYVLLHLWVVLGASEVAVRSLSVVCTVATIPVLYALTRRLLGPRVAWVACLLFSVNAFVVAYAQETRSYSLVEFLAVCSTLLFIRAIDRPSRRRWTAYVVVVALAPYAHVFALFIPVSHAVFLSLFRRTRQLWSQAIPCWLFVGLSWIPLALLVRRNSTTLFNWIPQPTVRTVFRTMTSMAGGGWLLLVYVVAVAGAVIWAVSRRTAQRRSVEATALLVCWLIVPIALSLVVSVVRPIFVDRYLIVSLPSLIILVALGLTRLRKDILLAPALALVVGLASLSLYRYYGSRPKENWRAAADYLEARATRLDLVYAPSEGLPLAYYLHRSSPRFRAGLLSSGPGLQVSFNLSGKDALHGARHVYLVVGPIDGINSTVRSSTAELVSSGLQEMTTQVFPGTYGNVRVITFSREGGVAVASLARSGS